MKGLEQFTDLLAMAIGMTGALLKGIKKRLKIQALISGMIIAGILSFSLIGVLEIFYDELTPRLIILTSFVVGWIANEVTEKIDLVFEDLYEYFLGWLRNQNKKNK